MRGSLVRGNWRRGYDKDYKHAWEAGTALLEFRVKWALHLASWFACIIDLVGDIANSGGKMPCSEQTVSQGV